MNVKLDCAALFLQQILKETAVNLGFFLKKKEILHSCSERRFVKILFSLSQILFFLKSEYYYKTSPKNLGEYAKIVFSDRLNYVRE